MFSGAKPSLPEAEVHLLLLLLLAQEAQPAAVSTGPRRTPDVETHVPPTATVRQVKVVTRIWPLVRRTQVPIRVIKFSVILLLWFPGRRLPLYKLVSLWVVVVLSSLSL